MQKAETVYDKLPCDYDDSFLHPSDPLQGKGESGKEKGAVAISEEKGCKGVYQDPLRNPGTDYQYPGKIRTKDFVYGI